MPDEPEDEEELPVIDLTHEADMNWLHADEPDEEPPTEEEIEERYEAYWEQQKSADTLTKAADDDLSVIVDECADAIEKSSWWLDRQDDPELSKSPGIWTTDDQVPEYVREAIREVIETTDWDWATFESLTAQQARELRDMLEEKLTQPQGWSVGSLARDIEREFDLPEDAAVGIAGDTSHNVLSTARMDAYDEMEGSEDFDYDWTGPDDHRRTPVCEEIVAEVNDRGGSVPKLELKQILRDKALKYEGTHEGGGTPERVKYWEPHYQCRHMAVRRV